jgi:4-amino-4-deoxy-L-arabinose transferase-like glycosyltransferase
MTAFDDQQRGAVELLKSFSTTTIEKPAPAAAPPGRHRAPEAAPALGRELWKRLQRAPFPLLGILLVQAGLSLRLIWSNTAFPDEALYLWSGHLEWSHWLHGTPIPDFQTYFSGAPVVYPPLGALADTYGGLAGARMLSLAFMLGATVLLYATARYLFGRLSATFSAALFVGLTAAQYLGAFATYDAMALFLLALACWLGLRVAVGTTLMTRLGLAVLCGVVLAAAGAAKYAAGLFIPVVLVTVVLFAWWYRSGRSAAAAAAAVGATFGMTLAALLATGGHSYWQGITYTTLARAQGNYPARFLLYVSGRWTGAVVLLAVFGTAGIAANRRRWQPATCAAVLAAAAFLVPAEQARIHTYTSLYKHLAFGGWFVAIPAGFCLAALPRAVPAAKFEAALRVAMIAAVLAAIPALWWTPSHYGWPDTTRLLTVAARVIKQTPGPVLTDDRGNVLDYYYPALMSHRTVNGTFFFAFNSHGVHLTDQQAYAAAIGQRYFSVIFLEFWDSAQADRWVAGDIAREGGYHLVSVLSYGATGVHGRAMIWVRSR